MKVQGVPWKDESAFSMPGMRNSSGPVCEYLDDQAGKGLDITPQDDRMAELLSSGSESCVLVKVDMEE